MQPSFTFVRIFFQIVCVLSTVLYAVSTTSETHGYIKIIVGSLAGLAFGYTVINLEQFFKRFNLRSFNTVIIGLFFGYLMGIALLSLITTALSPVEMEFEPETLAIMRTGLFLFTCYLGLSMTIRTSDEFYISIPFVNLKPNSELKKDLIIDQSVLLDSRFIDLATSGLLDSHLILPRFLVKELADKAESADETERNKARRCQETIKRLESITNIDLRYSETDFGEISDLMKKNVELANILNANIFITDANRVSQSKVDGVRLVNIHTLSNPFKPMAHLGEYISIKIQRFGKDPRQGIGYMEDGTMVVVNGGAEFIGDTIRAQVLSVKHTSSGRMIFCNASDLPPGLESSLQGNSPMTVGTADDLLKNYFAK